MSDPSHPESRVIDTSILIQAPLSTVRTVLLDFEAYPTWSTFVTSVKHNPASSPTAALALGDALTVTINPPGGSPMTMTPKVVHLDERGFGWQGHLANISGLFDGKHLFLLEQEGDMATRLTHREEFGGVLYTPLMSWLGMGAKTKQGFEAFNEAVKRRAEEVADKQ
ncbi:hypothetical protein EX895_006390 [Sporisorium graminicola]|uniref:Coenzyme Q-binding protein COQ10 START domain-containing protein n=1 Tax=Sporisorium graminicola TaxID=280036 RepID=A0A4V6ETB5_9BASI|nr:hypothetical protein EX895_006390 [Sporisorium graminicola]TKY84489.1 hypothetical protein EX895_006390 [Sporisorium graminicola]